MCAGERVMLRKTVSVDEQLLQVGGGEQPHLRLLRRLERGHKKACSVQNLGTSPQYDNRKKSDSKVYRLAQRWNLKSGPGDVLMQNSNPLLIYTGTQRTSASLDRRLPGLMSQQKQNLHLTQDRKCPGGPTSPSAAKRLYRNLSEKLRGSTSSFEDTHFFGKMDRLRKGSTMPSNEMLLEAVEQQDLDSVQILLYQFSAEDLDLNTPDSRGLTPLDIAIMTNHIPIAKLLLKAGAKESPHFVSVESREAHLDMLVLEAAQRTADLAARAQRDGLSAEACQKDEGLQTWEWRTKLYKRMRMGFQHARAPEAPSMVRLSVSSSTTLTVSFQEPQCFNSSVITKYKDWRESDGREPKRRGRIEAMERLLQQVRAAHTHYCCGDVSKLQNTSRKQSVSRSLKHLFNSSNKFVKTLKRGVYLAAIFYCQDSLLVTSEDQIPIVEVDDSYSSSLMHDFLWFTKLSCMWEDVRWLRQTTSVSTSASSALQIRHKLLTAAGQLQSMLGTHNLGRVHYEPIKDRHGNVLFVTVRDTESHPSVFSGKWMQVSKLQSQRKSMSTPEEPYALDILIITIQDLVAFHRHSSKQLTPGLYLGYLKLSSSVDQIRVLVSQQTPNVLCHSRIRDNANVSSQEVVELAHGVSLLLLLPAADSVCSAPGQSNLYTPLSGFLRLPLQTFEMVHFYTYKEKFISLYCRLSSVLDLDALITQQALREAITDDEVSTAKQKHQLIVDFIQQLDEMRRDLRWITDALQYARYKKPHSGVPIPRLVDTKAPDCNSSQDTSDSTSSAMEYMASPSPSPKLDRRKTISYSLLGSDEDGSSEVFLPADSDYDSSDALSPRDLDLLYSPPQDLSQQALHLLGGSAPDVLQIHELSVCPPKELAVLPVTTESGGKDSPLSRLRHSPSLSKDFAPSCCSPYSPLSPVLSDATKTLEGLSLSENHQEAVTPLRTSANPPTKRKLLSRSHRGQYFSGPHRWLRGQSGECYSGSLSEGTYTKQVDPGLPPSSTTYVSHASCVLESRKGRHKELRPHVRKIFVEACKTSSSSHMSDGETATQVEAGGEEPEGASNQEVDSDDQTNAQVSEILSSTL
ncbi:hypothetical protein fugu_000443 [Takifugu bimaculatus]|uniref:Uncharacterized protein n=1 Tax=Takifugu bimaculatus TaxID=433685 RepID=A0A4Z2CH70_9TELE|nr:hypothetical protein fugu_000443 [Takifugu bimaculatus]